MFIHDSFITLYPDGVLLSLRKENVWPDQRPDCNITEEAIKNKVVNRNKTKTKKAIQKQRYFAF